MDLSTLVQWKLLSTSENVVISVKASLVQGWVRTTRVVALVNYHFSHALFILTSANLTPSTPQDLSIERIVPIDYDLKCELDSDGKQNDSSDLFLSLTAHKLKLLFELELGEKSNMFVSELYKAIDKIDKKNGSCEFGWLNKYTPLYKIEDASSNVEVGEDAVESSEFLPRESIAKGATLLADRETVIKIQMALKQSEYTYKQSLRVFIGTWNVNGQPPTVGLADWLSCDIDPPDIYAVGFQELDLSKEAFLFNDTPREEEWRMQVERGLHNGAKYHQVALVRLVGMMLIVFVQTKHKHHVRRVAIDTVGTGIMGKMGNKGGVSIRMDVHNTSMCFVNSHLAAHIEEFERRNQDYKYICLRTSFNCFSPPKTIKEHDQIYWLGDLNYRITGLDVKVVKDYIARENYKPILENDQLIKQRRIETIFVGFKEGPINFMPTYKYDTGTDNWDSSEKNRAPAWCDRILWKGEGIKQLEYRSHQIFRISDHKPVSSVFMSEVGIIDEAKYRKIHEEVMKTLDKLENEFLPQVTVDTTDIKFSPVSYLESQSRTLTIANNGQVPVKFEFIKKLDDVSYCKDWLSIEPHHSNVNPGETCEIRLEVLVDKRSAHKLNSGQDVIYDILVLHLVGGKDIFITVAGEYERSSFGCSLETLANVPGPIREVPAGKLIELEKLHRDGKLTDSVGCYVIPKEIWFLVDHLHRHGMKQSQLFIQSGLRSEIEAIRNWLDSWALEPLPGSVYSVAEALLLLLESTAEPIIPYEVYSKSLDVATSYIPCKKIIEELPFHSKNVFIYLCSFLRELLTHCSENGLDVNTLATLFGGIFIRDPPWLKAKSPPTSSKYWVINQNTADRKKATFVSHFLVNDDPQLNQLVVGNSLGTI